MNKTSKLDTDLFAVVRLNDSNETAHVSNTWQEQ